MTRSDARGGLALWTRMDGLGIFGGVDEGYGDMEICRVVKVGGSGTD